MGLVKLFLEGPQNEATVDMHECVCIMEKLNIEVFHIRL